MFENFIGIPSFFRKEILIHEEKWIKWKKGNMGKDYARPNILTVQSTLTAFFKYIGA